MNYIIQGTGKDDYITYYLQDHSRMIYWTTVKGLATPYKTKEQAEYALARFKNLMPGNAKDTFNICGVIKIIEHG